MASTIDDTSIDATFPVAGQDNNSQGFRDNFNQIKFVDINRDDYDPVFFKNISYSKAFE